MSNRVIEMVSYVEGGVCRSLEEIAQMVWGIPLDAFNDEETALLDEALFTCERCDWTMPREEESEDYDSLCRECSEEVEQEENA